MLEHVRRLCYTVFNMARLEGGVRIEDAVALVNAALRDLDDGVSASAVEWFGIFNYDTIHILGSTTGLCSYKIRSRRRALRKHNK
jgi:hypothetical protein